MSTDTVPGDCTPPHILNDTDQHRIDELVLLYLNKRGYTRSVDQLKSELNKDNDFIQQQNNSITNLPVQHKLSQSINELAFNQSITINQQILKNLINYNITDISPDNIIYQYDSLLQWVHKCLSIYRNELEHILYPLYVHVYVYMIEYNYVSCGMIFIQRYKQYINHKYDNEIKHLTGLTNKYQLKSSEFIHYFNTKKYELYMSQYSYNLLISFIEEHNYMFILKYINNNCMIKIVSKKPNFMNFSDFQPKQQYYPRSQITAQIKSYHSTIQPITNKPVYWGILSDYAELQNNVSQQLLQTKLDELHTNNTNSTAIQQLRHDEQVIQSKLSDDSMKMTSRDRAKYTKEKNELLNRIEQIENDEQNKISQLKQSIITHIPVIKQVVQRNDDTVPLPKLNDTDKYNYVQDLLYRAQLSATQLPSILQLSIINQSQLITGITCNTACTLCCVTLYNSTSRLYYLNSDQSPVTLTGHTGPVYKSCFSPDSQYLLTCSSDCTIRLYHVPTLTNPVVYRGHNYPVWDIKFSRLGLYFITVSHDKTARLWSTDKIYPLRIFVGHISDIECVTWHPNQLYIATGSMDCTVRLYDIHTGDCIRIYTAYRSSVKCITISECGQYIAAGDELGCIYIHNIESSKLICEWSTYTITNDNIKFSAAGITGRLPDTELSIPHTQCVTSMVYSHDNTILCSTSLDGTVKLWSTKKYKSLNLHDALLHTYITHNTKCIYSLFTPRNLLVVAGVYTEQT